MVQERIYLGVMFAVEEAYEDSEMCNKNMEITALAHTGLNEK